MSDQRVVFIRGTGRCGSKNLVSHLGQHPGLAHIPVNQVLPEELIDWSVERLQASDHRIGDQAIADACRAYFAAYGRAMAGDDGILLQKSTRNAHHLSTLLEYWPEAKIVYLVRHPFGVVEAFINGAAHDRSDGPADYGYSAGVADSLLQWYTEIREYLESPAYGHPRLMQVQFERLIADPVGTVSQVLDFLALDQIELPPYGGPELYDDAFVLNEQERTWILQETTEVLARLGYDPSQWNAGVPNESVQLLDNWPECRLRGRPASLDVAELAVNAIEQAADLDYQRIGLFGAGYLTRRACGRLVDQPSQPVCIFDEDPTLHGMKISGYPVCSPQRAAELGVEAVVAMTFVHQEKLINRWREMQPSVPILPLWNEAGQQGVAHTAVLTEGAG